MSSQPLGRPPATGHMAAGAELGQRAPAGAHPGPARAAAGVWYFGWLLNPDRVGTPYLYGILIAAELFNLIQALGFWWTCASERVRERRAADASRVAVDVFVPVYNEPVDIVDLTVAAAAGLRGAEVQGLGARRRQRRRHARPRRAPRRRLHPPRTSTPARRRATSTTRSRTTDAAVHRRLRLRPRGGRRASSRPRSGTWTTPTSRSSRRRSTTRTPTQQPRRRGVVGQQALFFGAIARGKDGHDAMFCCGTNVVFRRDGARERRRLPDELAHRGLRALDPPARAGWSSRRTCRRCSRAASAPRTWPPTSPSSSAGPAAACRGIAAGAARAAAAAAARRSTCCRRSYFLSGWTVLDLHELPGHPAPHRRPADRAASPRPSSCSHFAPYFALALTTAALPARARTRSRAFALAAANFWIHCLSTVYTVLGKAGSFVVTPKKGAGARQPGAVMPALVVVAYWSAVSIYGLIRKPGRGHAQQRLASPPSTSRS